MNRLFIIGNLTRDPESKQSQSGSSMTVFTVAADEGKKTEFFRVTAWDKLGETCQKYLLKGRKVCVEGIVSAHAYTDKNGAPAVSLDVTAKDVKFLSPKESIEQSTPVTDNDLPY